MNAPAPPPGDDPLGYDELPYPSGPYPYSHCDHLATVARLFAIKAADAKRCRVLEVGCADGANLIPMALTLPDSQFVGIDLSGRQIQAGQELVGQLGLRNVELRRQNLTTFAASNATFDYVIAHGVFSWTTRDVQDSLLNLCRTCLTPHGVALVSYNVYPGWQQRKALREWLRQATGRIKETAVRLRKVRQMIASLRAALRSHGDRNQQDIARTIAQLETWSDGYLRHDLLEESNEPFFFSDFIERATSHGLRFFAEADVASMAGAGLPPPLVQATQRLGGSLVGREQLLDLLTNRAFRQSLLCHAECAASPQLDVHAVRQLYVVSTLRQQPPGEVSAPATRFASPGGMMIDVEEPEVAGALASLQAAWPRGRWFPELLPPGMENSELERQAQSLAHVVLAAFVERAVELHTVAAPVASVVEEFPRASPLARLQATQGDSVTNLRHDIERLKPAARQLLAFLDGAHDRSALQRQLAATPLADGPDSNRDDGPDSGVATSLDDLLYDLLRRGLLMA